MSIILKNNYWGDEYCSGVYIQFLVNDRVIWESSWQEGDRDSMNELRKEVKEQADLFDIVVDTKSYDPNEWEVL